SSPTPTSDGEGGEPGQARHQDGDPSMSGDTYNTVSGQVGSVIQARDISGGVTGTVHTSSDDGSSIDAPKVEGEGTTFIYGGNPNGVRGEFK
ncbi:hypothetical protein, partial [Streptomyces iconiensis]